jgi:anti-sigma-K factor RskA
MIDRLDPDLLAAYATDALEPDEREQVAALLADDPEAQAEVERYREALGALTPDAPRAGPIPDGLWARLRVEEAAPADDTTVVPLAPHRAARRERTGRSNPVLLAVAAVVALLVGVALGALLAAARVDEADLPAAVEAAFDDPDATVTELTTDDGAPVARLAVLPNGEAFLDAEELDPADQDRAYQVWQLGDGDPIALGLVGPDEVATFRLGRDAAGVAISDEPATGSVQPTGPIVAAGELS